MRTKTPTKLYCMKFKNLFLGLCFVSVTAMGQDYFPKNDGVKVTNNNYTALTNARVYVSPTQIIDHATLLIKEGKVVSVGAQVNIPLQAVVTDLKGKTIYPSFIDLYSDFGVSTPKSSGGGRGSQYDPSREGFYWNDHIMPENNAIDAFSFNNKEAKELMSQGFGVVNTHLQDGIARGSGALIALNPEQTDAQRILASRSAQYFSFNKSRIKKQSYPGSLMGSMALLRQFFSDAAWYAGGNSNTRDRSIEAFNANKNSLAIFDASDKGNILRADQIGDQANIRFTILGGGDAYEDIASIKAANAPIIVPLNFPVAYDVEDPFQASYVSLEDMRAWNQAPMNPAAIAAAGIPFTLTAHGLKNKKDFLKNLQKAVQYGLDKTKALAALTTTPASLLGRSDIGHLKAGAQANFIVSSGDIFESDNTIYEHWIQGTKNILEDKDILDIRGSYRLSFEGRNLDLKISGSIEKPAAKVSEDSTALATTLKYKEGWLHMVITDQEAGGKYRMSALATQANEISGKIVLVNGTEAPFTATKTEAFEEKDKKASAGTAPEIMPVTYPNVGYGYAQRPKAENTLFKNATVWTSEAAGVLEQTDVLVKNGKISKIGKDLSAGNAKVVDATGKHLTAGIIDEHSHIALKAVNEGGQNSSAEVNMEDVVDPEHMGIYRDLAGGVTSMQLLHGSANPIGGRSAIIKLKWGAPAKELIYENSPKFIKFALGENVKQSNWQSYSRFPQTRMGVEQMFVNYFQRAKEYEALKKSKQPYRYDEEMEVLVEILNGERFISAHSYVQSEINMLMKVAEQFGFRVNTFTHILEGYKVADKMAEHGVGGSTFSDWWAYKYEVNDAIPYNAAIMHSQGVTVAINSDDAEMSRRLNQEAAKTVKYGGMSEEEAWKMVTINPAKLLHIDHRVGSIAVGKDADLVLWNTHPLSVYAKSEKTMIEGVTYFDIETDKAQRAAIEKERNTLIQMMIADKKNGAPTQAPKRSMKVELHCDTEL